MEVACPKCRKRYKVAATLVGKKVRCADSQCGSLSNVKGPLGSASWCIPPNAKALASGNVEKFCRSDVFRLFQTMSKIGSGRGGMPKMPGAFPGLPQPVPLSAAQMTSAVESVVEFRLAVTEAGNPIVILRTKQDQSLEQAASTGFGLKPPDQAQPFSSESKTAGGVPYAAMGTDKGFVAKIAASAFCIAQREQDLQEALARLQRSEVVPLGDPLRRAWEMAQGDILVAIEKPDKDQAAGSVKPVPRPGATPLPPPPEWVSVGITTDSSLGVQAAIGFLNEADATSLAASFNNGLQTLEKQASTMESQISKMPAIMQGKANAAKDLLQRTLQLARAIHVSQNGAQVQFNGKWVIRDVESLIQKIQAMDKSSPF